LKEPLFVLEPEQAPAEQPQTVEAPAVPAAPVEQPQPAHVLVRGCALPDMVLVNAAGEAQVHEFKTVPAPRRDGVHALRRRG
jgi:hypothetical protein